MCSVHANSAHDAVTKICTLPLLAGEKISSAFDEVVSLNSDSLETVMKTHS